jgi:hypothetical protein
MEISGGRAGDKFARRVSVKMKSSQNDRLRSFVDNLEKANFFESIGLGTKK